MVEISVMALKSSSSTAEEIIQPENRLLRRGYCTKNSYGEIDLKV